ncbi:DUF58 domain-containing protein [Halobacteriales archaeon QS_8_69_26]|nr:MAG: DUF58 domain-containing protein [Halobacteriales archaeon QS_8_69_26]
MSPSLTRRGWGALAVVAGSIVIAVLFGAGGCGVSGQACSLNAVVIPLTLGVVAAGIAAYRSNGPDPERRPPDDGFVGEGRTVRLTFEANAPVTGSVHDAVPDGVTAVGNRLETTIGARPIDYEVTYDERGVHRFGPVSVTVRDVLGLAERSFEFPLVDEAIAYPRVYELAGATRTELAMLAGSAPEREREEFDRLRKYQQGDSLRDVHWKTSAKQPDDDLVVKEFVAEEEIGDVVIAASAVDGAADAMAEAAASVAIHLTKVGVEVGVVAPDGTVPPEAGLEHRTRMLELLARTGPGEPPADDRQVADVSVDATEDGVDVSVGRLETTFASLAGLDPDRSLAERGKGRDARAAVARDEVEGSGRADRDARSARGVGP